MAEIIGQLIADLPTWLVVIILVVIATIMALGILTYWGNGDVIERWRKNRAKK